jgi:hypothetical protein
VNVGVDYFSQLLLILRLILNKGCCIVNSEGINAA